MSVRLKSFHLLVNGLLNRNRSIKFRWSNFYFIFIFKISVKNAHSIHLEVTFVFWHVSVLSKLLDYSGHGRSVETYTHLVIRLPCQYFKTEKYRPAVSFQNLLMPSWGYRFHLLRSKVFFLYWTMIESLFWKKGNLFKSNPELPVLYQFLYRQPGDEKQKKNDGKPIESFRYQTVKNL